MEIIIGRKNKRWTNDFAEKDVLGLDQAQKNKLNELPISDTEENPIDKWLCQNPPKSLIGKKAYALRDNDESISGWIVDVYPARMLLVKCFKDKENRPVEFERIISISKD